MAKINITAETARRIVEVGSESVYSNIQGIHKPERTPQRLQAGHYVGTTVTKITGPSEKTDVTVKKYIGDDANGNEQYSGTITIENVKCPLLQSTAEIPATTTVIISKNRMTGKWEIIEMACP